MAERSKAAALKVAEPKGSVGSNPTPAVVELQVVAEALRPAATAVIVGMGPRSTAEVPLALIQNRELWLTGTFRYANTYPTAIALATTGLVDLEAIITSRYRLEETEQALRAGLDDPSSVKVMVHP